ncbi:MAG TPA: hypothetical protein PKJ19_03525 [Flavobacteriales bacterium]|nr:hypothetical protein [Flavobacteriales bacterium]
MNQIFPSAFGGAVTGAQAGAPLGPIGMGVGAGVGLLSGIFSGQQANRLERDYKKAEGALQPNSPDQINYLNAIRQQERAFRTGTDPSSGFAMQNLRNAQSQTQANLTRAGGPGVVNNLLRSQAITNQGFANVGANAADRANQLMQFRGGLIDNIQARQYARQRELRNQAMERSASAAQNIQNTFQGALAMIPEMTAKFGQPQMGTASTSAATPQFAQSYNRGGMVGNQYVPGTFTGVNYNGLGTGLPEQKINFGFNY